VTAFHVIPGYDQAEQRKAKAVQQQAIKVEKLQDASSTSKLGKAADTGRRIHTFCITAFTTMYALSQRVHRPGMVRYSSYDPLNFELSLSYPKHETHVRAADQHTCCAAAAGPPFLSCTLRVHTATLLPHACQTNQTPANTRLEAAIRRCLCYASL
jgi:hypothetical protein